MKTHVLIISQIFPNTHKRKGEQTFFKEQINEAFIPVSEQPILGAKIHTIRSNYELWAKRVKEVQEGKAVLSLRYWSGKPRHSKQIEFLRLTYRDDVGIQQIEFICSDLKKPFIIGDWYLSRDYISAVAKNDGLSLEDFSEWFKKYDLSKPLAIIHFTKFRY